MIMLISAVIIGVIAVIIFFERGQRRIQIQYAKRMVGRKMYGGQTSYLPLTREYGRGHSAHLCVIDLDVPGDAGQSGCPWNAEHPAVSVPRAVAVQHPLRSLHHLLLLLLHRSDVPPSGRCGQLKKQGAFIPGIRPGKKTAEYIDRVVTRITFGGACYVSAVCVLPTFLQSQFNVPFYFGGTGLMIVVGVALDTVQQIESHLITRHYDGFTGPRGPRIRGRRSRS